MLINLQLFIQRLRQATTSERGASLVEYALLLAFIAMVCIGAVGFLGDQLSTRFDSTGVSINQSN